MSEPASTTPDGDLIISLLAQQLLGMRMPSKSDPEFQRALLALKRVNDRALAGQGGAELAKMGMACCALLLETLRRIGQAEGQKERGASLN